LLVKKRFFFEEKKENLLNIDFKPVAKEPEIPNLRNFLNPVNIK